MRLAFSKLQKTTVNFVMSVRPFVRMEKLAAHWTEFYEIWYFSIFLKSVKKIEFLLKPDKNNGYFTWIPIYNFFIISRLIHLRVRNVSDKGCRENKNTFCVRYPFFENRAVYEIRWKSIVEPRRPQMAIRRMRIVCWIPKATNTLSECVVFIALPWKQWLH